MVVRFGNVLGSRGSIVPLFQQQIAKGGPVTVTDPEIRRYFMTISEACSLVLKAGGVGENGGLYLLDMGESVRIKDLAEQLIRFHGYEPQTDIKIVYTGLRAGERMDEPLWASYEEPVETEHSRILHVNRRKGAPSINLKPLLEDLRPICRYDPQKPEVYRNAELLKNILKERVMNGGNH
jgi:FlaA1/EpsC-like NDP-sugar epimerase